MDALLNFGCKKKDIFTDHISGAKSERVGLNKCLKILQKGDIFVVWRLDRLGRSMVHLVSLIEEFKKRGVSFKSLCDGAIHWRSVKDYFALVLAKSYTLLTIVIARSGATWQSHEAQKHHVS